MKSTVTPCVTVLNGPDAVSVYVVVVVGYAAADPEDAGDAVPTPWSMEADVQWAVDHESAVPPPELTEDGLAENAEILHGGFDTVNETVWLAACGVGSLSVAVTVSECAPFESAVVSSEYE
jgi:hypothetical protein